jgi:cell division septum initiation protein DivIVA
MGSGQVSFQGAPRLSPEEQVKTADALLSQMEQQASALGKRQLRASAQSDVVLANCLKDKVTQLDVAIRSARERRSSLTNPELRDHAFTIISFQKANADRVVKEANQCVGKEAVVTGETTVSAQISVVLPPDENSSSFPVADAPTVILAPPVAASTDL